MKTLLILTLAFLLLNCSPASSDSDLDVDDGGTNGGSASCSYNGHTLHVGEEGGCYYYIRFDYHFSIEAAFPEEKENA